MGVLSVQIIIFVKIDGNMSNNAACVIGTA